MKLKLSIIVIILTSLALIVTGCAPSCPEMGSKAPDFTLETPDGRSLSLSDFRGKTVLLNFWATWCIPCLQEMPHFQAIYNERSNEGVAILAIDLQESASTVKSFVASHGFTFHVLLDKQAEVAEKYCLPSAIPVTLFINTEGIIKARKIGSFQNQGEIESMLDSL